jgi:hypothetical protein
MAHLLAGGARVRALALVLALTLAGPALAAPRGVRGVVRTLLRPVAGVHVVIPEAGRFARTDSLGRYDLGVLPPGLWSVTVAAVGYEQAGGTVTVRPDSTAPEAEWLLRPLHPEGGSGFLRVPPAAPARNAKAADSALADSLTRLPGPGPIVPEFGLYLTPEEQAARGTLPGPLGELLPQLVTADSITFESGGTGAPGFETWRQWSERVALQAAGKDAVAITARRVLAYTRTRAALAAGPNWIGWQASKTARAAIAGARPDATETGARFLDVLGGRLDAVFAPGKEPPRPKPVPAKASRKKKRVRSR